MNTAAYHYRQAESYLAGAAELRRQGLDQKAELLLQVAQVHAELAQVENLDDTAREMVIDVAGVEVRRELDLYTAGTGPEECVASINANPNWLRNHARNALAIARALEARNGTTH